jgi:hypothetical protein
MIRRKRSELKMSNPLREQMVKNIIGEHAGEPITVENLAKYLPDTFELGDDDLAPYQEVTEQQRDNLALLQTLTGADPASARPIEFEGEPEAITTRDGGSKEPEAVAESEAPGTPEQIEAATLRRIKADQDLANKRVAVIAATNVERAARDRLAKAIGAFQSGFAPMTQQELRNQHVKEQTEIRRKIASGEMKPPRRGTGVGKSVVDRTAFYGRGGNPATGNYRRGAYPSQAKGAPNFDPRRGATVKVPSEA